ncbi:MAG TPA: oxygen-independent coproporphyrinogen III oxidase [Steroidobacteraceae bacterium]|nr:oxygen-independent coproporphyrinogen III oxidase [Steroidobacteraceae bacterium]
MIRIPPELLVRHGMPGPRYTSYPAVAHWGTAPPAAQWLARLDEALSPAGARAGIYVHVPFCQSLCTFCGCNMRLARNHALAAPYVETVLQEFALYRTALAARTLELGELHLGGGSPTWLPPGVLDRLLDGLLRDARIGAGADFALEADPRNTTREHLAVLRRHGFNRLSIGVQDFDARVLEIVNRVQAGSEVRALVDTAREAGFGNIGFDLIYGLPLQTTESLATTFDVVATLRPERIAFLPYAHVPWIKPSQRRYTEADLPETALRHALLALGRERMGAMGYVEIGFDQYALPGDPLADALAAGRLSRNFMGFSASHTDALLGLGVSAIGDAGAAYAQNEKNLQRYEWRLAAGELPLQRGHVLGTEDGQIRALLWKLFSGAATAAARPAADWWPQVRDALEPLRADGLVEISGERITVTELGRAFLQRIGLALDRYLAQPAAPARLAT